MIFIVVWLYFFFGSYYLSHKNLSFEGEDYVKGIKMALSTNMGLNIATIISLVIGVFLLWPLPFISDVIWRLKDKYGKEI